MPQYEKAARRVLKELSIGVESLTYAACCGAPLESFGDKWILLAAYNMSLAERLGRDVVTLCGNCTNTLLRAQVALADLSLRQEVNDTLGKIGQRFDGRVHVKHLLQLLSEHEDDLRSKMTTELPVKVAVTHPCQVVRPFEVMRFDDPLQPQAMRRLVSLTGAQVVDYDAELDCCGSTLYLGDERLGLEAGRHKLASASAAEVLVDACGNCQLLLERFQGLLRQSGGLRRTTVLALPQLLGLAMGIDGDELGIGPATARQLARGSA
jgi:heterodisulfide reductase subunit B